ncbi:MAG: nicotinate-nucleotide adenylyltransferase [Parachlamydiales bacterium]|nr:nicotinate (nicotinamide) nucleotide adenylyltransferase [Verrucomicrobiota bacterium]MBX3719056.1 nicotinate-nucleotide adenylyltransferase [Candidatus Acheromyda pituitae]
MSGAKQRVGLFGGSFDPIHFGHINLALAIMEAHRLDRVVFCPAAVSPFKDATPPKAGKDHRKQMLQLAIQPIPAFAVLESELNREGLSYTIDTIKDVLNDAHAHKKQVDLFLMLGEDALRHFHRWKDVEDIVLLAPPLTGSRVAEGHHSFEMLSPFIEDAVREGMTKIPVMEISSTVIRQRLAKGLYCGHYVPSSVLEYIHRHQLYLE